MFEVSLSTAVSFELAANALLVRGIDGKTNLKFALDGIDAHRNDFRYKWDGGVARVELPPRFFDARPHRLDIHYKVKGTDRRATFEHRSEYDGLLNRIDRDIFGWVHDKTRPGFAVSLDVLLDGRPITGITAEHENVYAPEDLQKTGFGITPPIDPGDSALYTLDIRVQGTDFLPFGQYLMNIKPLHIQEALAGTLRDQRKGDAIAAFGRDVLLTAARQKQLGHETFEFPSAWKLSARHYNESHPTGIDVIIPVYRGIKETLACINSVLNAQVDVKYRLIVIDDCTPEPALAHALRRHAAKHRYQLLHNPENLGFVRTVNRGMNLSQDNDVVLLNADTLVSDGWLDRMFDAAYRDERVGSVSALSNNATICSLPFIGGKDELPYGLSLSEINDLCRQNNRGVSVDLPTAHGFCMYIRRACLQEAGLFDAELFGKGYGEENEFSLRSARRGWRHVAACDVFVYHKGSVSFRENADIFIQKNLQIIASQYPDYEAQVYSFLRDDPMAPMRNRLQIALWSDKPNVVLISLAAGGGVDTNVADLAKALTGEGYRVLVARRTTRQNYAYALTEWNGEACLLYTERTGLAALCSDILTLGPAFIHLHHVIDIDNGIDAFLTAANIPYYVTLHDYFYICPRVTLLDDSGHYCGVPDENACNVCLKRGGSHALVDASYAPVKTDINAWRAKWRTMLDKAAGVFAPSDAAQDVYRKVFADLAITTRPHGGNQTPVVSATPVTAPARIRVAILGAIGEHKGSRKLGNVLDWAESHAQDIEFVLVGYTDRHDELHGYDNFEDLGPYTPDTLTEKLADANAQVALFLSVWPETYVYTLSEALEHGLTPVGIDLGAVGSRLRALKCGELVPPDAGPARIVEAIRTAATCKIKPGSYSEGGYPSLVEDYYNFRLERRDPADCVMLPFSQGVFDDGWAGQDVVLHFAARKPVNHLQIELLAPASFGPQFVRAKVNGDDYAVMDIPPSQDPRRLDIITRPVDGLIRVSLSFALVNKLPDPDLRMASAKLLASRYIADDGLVRVSPTPNPLSVRLVRAGESTMEDLAEVDPSGALEGLYRDVANYSLFHRREGALEPVKALVGDMFWSARILRRFGPKAALKNFLDMRMLRSSSFDKTFYRMQLDATPRRKMDPVTHYVVFGGREGFDPAPGFSSEYYLKAHDDVAGSQTNPFVHFLRFGSREDRRIEPSAKIAHFFHSLTLGRPQRREIPRTTELSTPGTLMKLAYDGPEIARDLPVSRSGLPGAKAIGPDSHVMTSAADGEAFFKTFGLLGNAPRFDDAVQAIKAIERAHLTDTPQVSVIVPVYGELAYTLNALRSLLGHKSARSFEIIVADDASPDATADVVGRINGIRYIRYPENSGFLETCNKAASEARGEYLVFLNNDTVVCAGWLDALLETYKHFPKCGIAGSRLFYPDGKLQEAGGIVWRDGSAWNYGRDDDALRPEYGYAREADYVSGASLCIRKTLWDHLGGFDPIYRPAYYEDTDLAFRARKLGYQVVMQAQSKVVHYEGKTSGTDTGSGVKAYQKVNHDKFLARWHDTLLAHRENGQSPALERERNVTRRVLVADACNPTPDRDAGSQATVELIRIYRDLGYQVTFVPEDNFLYQREQIATLQAMGVQCLYAPYTTSMTQILRDSGHLYDVVNLIRPSVAFKNLDLVRQYCPRARLVYLNADLHYLRMERQAYVENKPDVLAQAADMKTREFTVIRSADVTLVHSHFERDLLRHELPDARVEVLPLFEQVADTQAPYVDREDLIFLGGYNHPPNLDAALWLADEVWPELSRRLPRARMLIVGANAPQTLKDRANDRFVVTGPVDDLSPWFDRSRVFLAALRYGAGAKGKVLKSLAYGVPVVATDIAVEGLDLENGKTVFIANGKDGLIDETVRLYEASARQWNRLSLDAQDYIADRHGHQVGLDVLRRVLA